jgi:dihydroneopterin aldolase
MAHTDHVFIDGMEVACRLGTTEEERAFPQVVSVSVKIYLPLKRAAESEDLSLSVDYAAVADDIRRSLAAGPFVLVEAVAEMVAHCVLKQPLVEAVTVRVEKRILAGIRAVGAEVHRERKKT